MSDAGSEEGRGGAGEAPPTSPVVATVQAGPGSAPRCVACGYSLLGMRVDDTCPECGRRIWETLAPNSGNGMAVASLVTGIVSIVLCQAYGVPSIVCGVAALVLASKARVRVASGRASASSLGMVKAGMICGWVGVGLGVLYVLVLVLLLTGAALF